MFLKGSADHTAYSTYSTFDSTIAGVSAGIDKDFTDTHSARLLFFGKEKRFEDSLRNSTAYGGAVSLRQRLFPVFWLRESLEYEKNSADSPLFSYTGRSAGVTAGYMITKKTLITAGYSVLVREYEEPALSEMTAKTVSLGLERTLSQTWSASAGIDRQESEIDGSSATVNNIVSLAIRYGY